jgi:hypothetical protein
MVKCQDFGVHEKDLLMTGSVNVVCSIEYSSIIKSDNIVAPAHSEPVPSLLNGDVMNASEESVSRAMSLRIIGVRWEE